MVRLVFVSAAFASSLAFGDYTLPGTQQSRLTLGADAPGCSKDTDCKGDRICAAGVCENPAPSPAPLVPADTSNAPSSIEATHRLEVIALRLEILKLSRVSLGLPIFLTIAGGTGTLAGGVLMVALYWAAWFGGIIVGLSLLPLSIGILDWVVKARRNRAIDADVEKLMAERASLGSWGGLLVEPPQLMELARF